MYEKKGCARFEGGPLKNKLEEKEIEFTGGTVIRG